MGIMENDCRQNGTEDQKKGPLCVALKETIYYFGAKLSDHSN
jgi:hypothetical protein